MHHSKPIGDGLNLLRHLCYSIKNLKVHAIFGYTYKLFIKKLKLKLANLSVFSRVPNTSLPIWLQIKPANVTG